MMPRKRLPMLIALTFLAVMLAAGAYFVWTGHLRSNLKAALATGYATQPLAAPFTLTGKSWDSGSQTWQYTYSAALAAPDAISAAKSQFAKGAYQVVSGQPDVISASNATLYRDLITEDVALTVKISPNSATTSTTTVTLAPMHN